MAASPKNPHLRELEPRSSRFESRPEHHLKPPQGGFLFSPKGIKLPLPNLWDGWYNYYIISNHKKGETKMAHKIAADKCVACGCCKDACPAEAISEGTPYVIDADKCVDCGACAATCPNEAIAPA